MSLSGEQFQYWTRHDPQRGKTSVVAYDQGPVGAVQISHGDRESNAHQRAINDAAARGAAFPQHTVFEVGNERTAEKREVNAGQIPGQQHWGGGAFQPSGPDYISWLHAPKPSTIKPMLGLAVQARGRVPVADAELSDAGARFSQSMGRKMGIQGHPKNPTMEPTLHIGTTHAWQITEQVDRDLEAGLDEPVEADPETLARGVQTANAMAAPGREERRQRRRTAINQSQFEQLSFDI